MAPEMHTTELNVRFTNKIDIWAMGVVLHEMFTSTFPYFGLAEIVHSSSSFKFTSNESKWNIVSDNAKQMIEGTLQKNSNKRYSIDDVHNDAWLASDQKLGGILHELIIKSESNMSNGRENSLPLTEVSTASSLAVPVTSHVSNSSLAIDIDMDMDIDIDMDIDMESDMDIINAAEAEQQEREQAIGKTFITKLELFNS